MTAGSIHARRPVWIGVVALSAGGLCAAAAALPLPGLPEAATTALTLAAAALLAVSAAVLIRAGARGGSAAETAPILIALAGGGLLGAGLLVGLFQGEAGRRHGAGAHAELVERGAEVSERWMGLLADMEEAASPPATLLARVAIGPPGRAFRELAAWSETHPLLGAPAAVALFSRDGRPLVWSGPLGDLRALPSGGSRFLRARVGASTYLVCRREIPEGPLGLVQVELLLSSPSPTASRTVSRTLGFGTRNRPGDLLLPALADGTEQRLDGTAGDASGTAASSVRVPLRDGDGTLLAVARLLPVRSSILAERFRKARLLLASMSLLLALLAGLLGAVRTGSGAGRRFLPRPAEAAVLVGLVVLARLGLSALLRGWAGAGPLTGPGLFARASPMGLLASPADIGFTAAAVLCVTLIVLAAARTFEPGGRLAPRLLRAGAAVAGAAWLAATLRFIHLLPSAGKINPARFQLLDPDPPRLALQAAAIALAASPIALLLVALAGGSDPRRRRPLRAGLAVAVLAGMLAAGALVSGGRHAARLLVERDLSRDVLLREERLERILEEVLAHSASDPRWRALLDDPSGPPGTTLAYDCWSKTELAVDGARSAVAVIDRRGRLRSEFTLDLPPGIHDASDGEPPSSEETLIARDDYRILSLRIPLLRGEGPLVADGEVVGRLVVQVSREPDNLPFLTRNDPLATTHSRGGRDPIYDEMLGGEPVLLIYSPGGEIRHSSALRPPVLTSGLQEKIVSGGSLWRQVDIEGRPHEVYYFPFGEEIAALGFHDGGWRETLSALVRFVILALAGGMGLRGGAALLTHPLDSLRAVTTGWVGTLRRSYSRRLLAALLLASMLPLLGLSAYLRAQVRERTLGGLEAAGVSALDTARRLLQDYLEVGAAVEPLPGDEDDPGAPVDPIDDDALFWLSRVVRQGLAIYVDGRLAAASRPELYTVGLLPRCLDGAIARSILARRAPYVLREEALGSQRASFIYAPIALPGRADTGVLALPLTASEKAQRREADAVGEDLLTVTALLGVLLAAIAFATSRRISEPIRGLTRAAARIARGDYSVHLPVRTEDETGVMVDAFNRMAQALEGQREDLRRRGDYIEKILLNATTGVISTDPTGRIRTINPAARLLLESQEAVEGRPLSAVLTDRPKLAPIAKLLTEAIEAGDRKIERELDVSAGSEERRLRCVVLPLREEATANPGRIILLEDLTEIVRSNRLAAWAEMARRIAHEIKNPLTPIQLSAEHLQRLHRDGDPSLDRVLGDCVRTILSQVHALREISSEFSIYSRLPDLQFRPTEPAALVREVLAPYLTSPPRGVRIEQRISPTAELPLDGRVLRRALVNLIENALQAMPDGGTLGVSVGNAEDGAVRIEIADSGEGMDEAMLARIFEPYFSTRDAGTGLGLAIARRAVEEHGGRLTARSAPGRGTTMTILLPAGRAAPPGA